MARLLSRLFPHLGAGEPLIRRGWPEISCRTTFSMTAIVQVGVNRRHRRHCKTDWSYQIIQIWQGRGAINRWHLNIVVLLFLIFNAIKYHSGKEIKRSLGIGFVRRVTDTFSISQNQFLLPSMTSSCELWGRLSGTQFSVEGLIEDKVLLWIGPKKKDKLVILCASLQIKRVMIVIWHWFFFLSGGAFVLSADIFIWTRDCAFWLSLSYKERSRPE